MGKCDYSMPKLVDLTGKKFGRLTVIKREITDKKYTTWLCKCDCGNEKVICSDNLIRGRTKSCGCLSAEEAKKRRFIDLTGQKFNYLTVICVDDVRSKLSKRHEIFYKSLCDCGNYSVVSSQNLKTGHIKSCGCMSKLIGHRKLNDLTGNKFGLLTVVKRAENQNTRTMWECLCECGNITTVNAYHLLKGYVKSCGCIKSFGERDINTYLVKHNIKYISQKKFDGLIGVKGRNLSYDFFLPDYSLLIECQGEQHYHPVNMYGGKEQFKIQCEHDKRKREYAKQYNYDLLEIPYNEYKNIENILNNKLRM